MSSATSDPPVGRPVDQPIQAAVDEYIAAVRAQLDDLGSHDREDQLEGLDADLLDVVRELDQAGTADDTLVLGAPQWSVATALRQRLGDPKDYARELRAAAGLPPRTTRAVRRLGGVGRAVAAWRERVAAHPGSVAALPVLRDIRPAWWVLRAWVAVQLVDVVLGRAPYGVVPQLGTDPYDGVDVLGIAALLVATWASVQLGRGAWLGPQLRAGVGRRAVVAVDIVLAVALFVVVPAVDAEGPGESSGYYYAGDRYEPRNGLRQDGERISNVFAFDVAGRPLPGVRLYDEDGEPLELYRRWDRSHRLPGLGWVTYEPVPTVLGRASNVAPLPVEAARARSGRDRSPTLQLPPPPMPSVEPLRLAPEQRTLADGYGIESARRSGRDKGDTPARPD